MSEINKPEDPYLVLKSGLETAVYEAQLLVDYAAKEGLKIEENSVKHIVQLKQLLQQNQWTSDDEVNFWLAFSSIAGIVKPVTVASLKSSSVRYSTNPSRFKKHRNSSPASKAVRRYRNWTFYTLVFLLIIQIYWLVGSKVLKDLEEIPKKISEIGLEMGRIQRALNESTVTESTDNKSPDNQSGDNNLRLRQLELDIKNYNNQAETSGRILMKWNNIWLTLLNPIRLVKPAQSDDQENLSSPEKLLTNQTSAKFVIEILQSYLLPLLYGLLGACTYVLRVLSAEINKLTYSSDGDIRYRLRLYLGILSGLLVAWFFAGESRPSMLQSLPPMALAFLSGYSVEVIFAIMDKFISNFSSEPFQRQGTGSK